MKFPPWSENKAEVSSVSPSSKRKTQSLTKSQRSKRQLRYLFTVEIWSLSTCLIPNFSVSIPHRRGTTVSLEINLSFVRYSGAPWVRKCGDQFGNHVTVQRGTDRPHHRHTNTKFRVVCGKGFLTRKRMATRVLWSINKLEVQGSQRRTNEKFIRNLLS